MHHLVLTLISYCMGIWTTTTSRWRGRGKAKGTMFEKLPNKGQIAVEVPMGARGLVDDNETIFKERVTYLYDISPMSNIRAGVRS